MAAAAAVPAPPSEAPSAAEVAAQQREAGAAFMGEVEALCVSAAPFLEQLARQADEADSQQLRTAALKLRLSQLAGERRKREAQDAAALQSRQKELERLLQAERALGQDGQSPQ